RRASVTPRESGASSSDGALWCLLGRPLARAMTLSMRRRWRIAPGSAAGGQILLRQHLPLLDRRLIERVDAEEMRGDDRLQHELHQQLTEARLVQLCQMDGTHRAAVLRQRLGGGAALRRDEIADGLASEIGLAGERRKLGIDPRAAAGGADRDD